MVDFDRTFLRSVAQISFQQLVVKAIFHVEKIKYLIVKEPLTVPRSIRLTDFV